MALTMASDQDVSDKAGRLLVPRSRLLVADVLRLHRQMPTCAHNRLMRLSELAEARDQAARRISWPALFIRSWGQVCARNPQLLQTWRNWPWGHIFQHSAPVGTLAMNRRFQNEDWLFWGRIRSPQQHSLESIQDAITRFAEEAPDSVFRQQLQMSRLPSVLRRLVWWWNLNIAGEKRARRIGTFFLTTVSAHGVEIQHPPGVMTTGLTYGPLDRHGMMKVTLTYDHRLMDGSFVASRLVDLEDELTGNTLTELLRMRQSSDATLDHASDKAA